MLDLNLNRGFFNTVPSVSGDLLTISRPGVSMTVTPDFTRGDRREFQKIVAELDALASVGAVRIEFRQLVGTKEGHYIGLVRFTRVW